MAPTVGDESLDKWELLGTGGFGYVYKARHKDRGDVAVKILRGDISPFIPLCEEANIMNKAFSKYVVQCYGSYHGCKHPGGIMRNGIVMEFMERGSVETLQTALPGRPPWPLVFRWAYQVAQSLKFLHSQILVHQDLKPSNVLLDIDLNAKLADFGLTRYSASVVKNGTDTKEYIVGTHKYKPPEAFEESYEPVRAFDIYSYGILLWSIVSGKEPYGKVDYSRVKLRVCDGDRPNLKEIELMEVDGLRELVHLMKRCWDPCVSERPSSEECSDITENLFLKYKYNKQVHKAVSDVSENLDSKTSNQHSETSVALSVPPQTTEQANSNDTVDIGSLNKTDRSSRQQDPVSGSDEGKSDEDKKCSDITENLLSKSKTQVHEAASQVPTKLDSKTSNQHSETSVALSVPPQTTEWANSNDTVDIGSLNKTDRSSRQDPVSGSDEGMSDEDKKTFVDDNRKHLINRVSEVMAIIEELASKKMVHSNAYSRIKSLGTNEDKVRELYDTVLLSGGIVVKAAFYDALKDHHPTLVQGLKESSA